MSTVSERSARSAPDWLRSARLAASALASVIATAAEPAGRASAQGCGYAPSRAPYAPPWRADGRSERRELDGTLRSPRPAPAPPEAWSAPRAPIWQGLHLGGHGGLAIGQLTDRGLDGAVRLQGAAAGLHAGYGMQAGQWVVGVEADGTWSNADGRRTIAGPLAVGARHDWHSTLRLRAGHAFGNVLVYGTAGAALAGLDVAVSDPVGAARTGETLLGWAAGAGVETRLAPGVSARVEALHFGFAGKSLVFPTGRAAIDLDTTVIRAGLTFHFE